MEKLTVELGARSYPILIGDGLVRDIGAHVAPLLRRPRTMIVTDAHVADHYLARLGTALAMENISFSSFVLDPGEATKSWAGLARLTEWLIGEGIERSDHVIALGGGVIGDLVGFACSIVKRGCNFIQLPTTLLAQVDSSVGGKTAINVPAGKNLIGAFHQPAMVVIDPTTLETLPRRELGAGYAEVVKYGLIDDANFFAWCEANGAALLAGDSVARAHAIAHSVAAKARIVAADERETQDIRALLNLGHSFGHSLEAEPAIRTGYFTARRLPRAWFSRTSFPPSTVSAPPPTRRVCGTIWRVSIYRTASQARASTRAARSLRHIWPMTRRCAAESCRSSYHAGSGKVSSPTNMT